MSKKVESIKHKGNNRPHIPSKEEAGYEDAIDKVQEGKKVLELNKYGNDDRDDLLRADRHTKPLPPRTHCSRNVDKKPLSNRKYAACCVSATRII